jgi:thiamine biosynthesis lipoprotein
VVSDGRYAMGTVLELTLRGADEPRGRELLERLYARSAELEALFSSFDPASALSRLNAAAGGGPQPVPAELARILRDAERLAARSGGAFDVGVGAWVALWRDAEQRGRLPTAAERAAVRARVGPAALRLEAGAAALAPGARLELGGLAKGWALDRMAEELAGAGVSDALLSFGGSSVLALGSPGQGERWRLLVRAPGRGYAGVIALRDQALSVSGSLGQWSEVGGRRLGHVIDPRSGEPLERPLVAVVLAPSAGDAEAWSKALLVLGEREGIARLEAAGGVEGLLLGEGGRLAATRGFDASSRFEALP